MFTFFFTTILVALLSLLFTVVTNNKVPPHYSGFALMLFTFILAFALGGAYVRYLL
jgi:hypothetical protein